jgi:hypothetical protein
LDGGSKPLELEGHFAKQARVGGAARAQGCVVTELRPTLINLTLVGTSFFCF